MLGQIQPKPRRVLQFWQSDNYQDSYNCKCKAIVMNEESQMGKKGENPVVAAPISPAYMSSNVMQIMFL